MKGLIKEKQLKQDILDRFIEKFTKDDYVFQPPQMNGKLMWCNLKDKCKIFSTEKLFQLQLKIDSPVYFYDEFTEELFLANFEDIRNFINDFNPWDEVDAEIFDDSLEWVIAITHEDLSLVSGLNITIDEYDYDKDMVQDNI